MSEQYFLEKCIVTVEDVKGSYAEMAHLDVEPLAKEMYENMVADITRHLRDLNSRLKYLKEHHPSNNPNSRETYSTLPNNPSK